TAKKIMQAVTDRTRLRKTDIGHPEQCEVVFDYYKVFSDEETVKTVCEECQKAQRGCADCKKQLAKIINNSFAPIREERKKYSENPDIVKEILSAGRDKARPIAQQILQQANDAVGISM
ncbi:tryptophan--tRNA ligase, partial [bacterium]|nr:tryptophan--tRNA ligase [bacterium]